MYHFIINPDASSGKGMKIWNQVEAVLKREQVLYKAYILHNAQEVVKCVKMLTGSKGKAEQEKENSLHNMKSGIPSVENTDCRLVVLGGDGTLNAVLNGIEDFEHTTISCIRTGSGNDFARNMGISKRYMKVLNGILYHPKEIVLDYGEICYLYSDAKAGAAQCRKRFVISSGMGYDADICEEVSRSVLKKRLNRIRLGKLVYLAIGIKQIFTRDVTKAVISTDEEEITVSGLFFVVGMIHAKEGGGVPFCPKADAEDGLLDVCLVKNMPKWKLCLAVALVYLKQHFLFRDITEYRCEKLEVEADKPQWVHMDGETPCQSRKVVMECKRGLRFVK